MDTLKTGFVVVLLLAVLYGVYVVLNKDNSPPTAEIAWHQQEAEKDLQIEISSSASGDNGITPAAPGGTAGSSTAGMGSAGGSGSASSLGIPSVLKAELTPSEPEESPAIDTKPASLTKTTAPKPTAPKSPAPSALPASPSSFEPTEPLTSPVKSSPVVPEPTVPPPTPAVPAPSLLPASPAADAAPNTPPTSSTAATQPASADPLSVSPVDANPLRSTPGEVAGAEGPASPSVAPATPELAANGETTAAPASAAEANSPPTAGPVDPVPSSTTDPLTMKDQVVESGAPPTPESASSADEVTTAAAYTVALREAHNNIADEKWYAALFLMSKFYDSPDLTTAQQQELVDLLDPLAAKVIYSPEHFVADPYEVQRGETLTQIAESFQVPVDLLANINGVQNPEVLVPGTKLKVVRGPFRADVNLTRQELTLFAGQLYAGRFPISVGRDPQPQEGQFRVLEKQPGRVYYAGAGQTISASDPQNPYGSVWIGLEKELAIHGSPEQGESAAAGCISLSPVDARDVYGILTLGSSVTIRR